MENVTKEVIAGLISQNRVKLSCTQPKLCIPIINRLYRKMSNGIKFSGIKVEKGLICDGHHRYIASLLANYPIGSVPYTTSAANRVIDWESIHLDDDDWDTPEKVDMLNKEDADFNGIALEKVIEFLK